MSFSMEEKIMTNQLMKSKKKILLKFRWKKTDAEETTNKHSNRKTKS